MAFDFDLFVIGGGSGGVRAARVSASEYGARVALAEEFRMGGTCVIRGCVPKKTMVFASSYRTAMREARAYGWDVHEHGFDWAAFRPALDRELARLEAAYRGGLTTAGVKIFDSRATIANPHTVRLSDGREFTAAHILIATGGRPVLPEAAFAAGALSSNDIFNLEKLPASLLIVGGGYIACEFAGIFAGLGSKVSQFYRGEQILRGFDNEARTLIAEGIRAHGVDLRTGTDIDRISRTEKGFSVRDTHGADHHFDQVVCATGRQPNSADMGLEEAGVTLGRHGEILVDEWSQTSVPSIFAVGDVTDRINLTPVAIREGHAFADTVFGARPTRADHALVASAVFTQPEFGTIGLTEEQAIARGPVEIYETKFRPMQSAFAGDPTRVMMKLIVDRESRKVLGCHIVAPHAGEMIQMVAIAVKMGATKEDFDRAVAVHPTMAEELVTMRKPVRIT